MSIKLYPVSHLLVGSHRILSLTINTDFSLALGRLVLILDLLGFPLGASIVLRPLFWYLGVFYAKLD